jgi:hypothetical protein
VRIRGIQAGTLALTSAWREGVVRSERRVGSSLITAPALAGIAYTTAWLLGLAVWPSNLDVAASDVTVLATYRAHQGAALMQYVLVEGLAAIALAVVVVALGRAARGREADWLGLAAMVAGLTAAVLSLVECALGLLLAGFVAPDREADRAGRLFDLINRLDGVKMLALAAMAVAGVGLVRRPVLPRWLGFTAAILTVALIASGAGYLLLKTTLAHAAFVSGPLLLVWVTRGGPSPRQDPPVGTRRRHDVVAQASERSAKNASQSNDPLQMKRTSSISFLVKSGDPPFASIAERRCSLTAVAVKSRRKCLMPFIYSS